MAELKKFSLPTANTCSRCGRSVLAVYAENLDQAVAGWGLCGECAGGAPAEKAPSEEAPKAPAPRPRSTRKKK